MKFKKSFPKMTSNAEIGTRLSKFLSNAGLASRRKADDMIRDGMICINGEIVNDAWRKVKKGDKVQVNGKEVRGRTAKTYIMLNKPSGVVCTCSDPNADIKVTDIVKIRGVRLFPVGRLDKDSDGLIFLTDDGDFANMLTHPRYEMPKTYIVRTSIPLPEESIRALLRGVRDEGEMLKAENIIRKAENVYVFIMKEGKKREIRRLVRRAGADIKRLRRTAVGEVQLDKRLPVGKWRHLLEKEIASLLKTAGKNN